MQRVILLATVVLFGAPVVASATAVVTPVATPTTAAPSFSWVDTEPTAVIFHVLRGATCGSAVEIDPNASSPFTDSTLALNGSDDGSYCYVVESHDVSDVLIDSGSTTIVLDVTDPSSVSFVAPPGNGTRVNADTDLNATAADATSGIASVQLQRFVSGTTWANIGPPDTSAPYDDVDFLTASLADGSYTLRLLATDNAGNVLASSSRTLVLDTVTAPTTITAPATATVQHGTITISFTNADASTPVTTVAQVSVHNANSFSTPTGLTTSSWNTSLVADGDWDLLLSSQDALGNPVATDMVTITVDNTAPTLTLNTFPSNNQWVRGTVSVSYTVSDAVTVSPSVVLQYDPPGGTSWTNAPTATNPFLWDTTLPVAGDGVYGLRVVATDGEGNQRIQPLSAVSVNVDNTLPALPVFTGLPANNAIIGAGPMIIPYSGGTDANLVDVHLETQTQLQAGLNQWTVRTSTTTSPLTWTPLAADDCTCSFRLVATDQAGNTRTSALRTNITIDNFAPLAPSLFKIDRTITNGPPILTWTASQSGDIVGYKLVRDSVHLQGGGGLLGPLVLTYTDTDLLRDGSEDGAHGYQLYANDGGNDSPVKLVSFLLDSMAPTPPTAATAKRRSGSRLVDLTWGESEDTQASSGATPTGVSRYVVRRAISPAVPSSATSGAAACDVAATATSCVDTTAPEGHTYRYAVFAVDVASNGSAGASPPAVTIPDLTAPGAPGAFSVKPKGLTIAMTWRLPTAPDLNKIVVVRNSSRSPKSITDGKVVFTGKAAKAAVKQPGGTTAFYRAFAVDQAGNASATPGVKIKQPVFRLFPENGSELHGTVRLTWKKPKRASYFNVQLYLGSKRVTQAWPKTGSFKVPRSKLTKGKTYTWYVWPGVGNKAAGRYGTMIGKSTFTYLG